MSSYGGLTDRLGQHAQRTGPLVGCSMALALVVCMVSGMVLYQRLDRVRVDVFGVPTVVQSVPTLPPTGTVRVTRAVAGAAPAVTPGPAEAAKPAEAPRPPEGPPPEAKPQPTPAPARYRVARTGSDNLILRSEASTQSPIVARLPPGTLVDDAGGQTTASVAGQNVVWRKVKGPGGQVGWVPEQYLDKVE